MSRIWMAVVLIVSLSRGADAAGWRDKLPPADKTAQYLQDVSVTIKASSSEGSGVIVTRIISGAKTNFVWTAAHVVDGLRSVEEVIDPASGTKRQVIKFQDARIVKELVESGRRVGELAMDAQVIRFSKTEDLALLKVRKTGFVDASAVFYLDETIPPIGTKLLHVGSLLGQLGANSMTSGIQSQIGRTLEGVEFDQQTVTAFPGSSGGGVFLENGAYIACLVRGAGEGFNLSVPVRRIRKWAIKANIAWALDESVAAPSQADLEKLPVEDSGATFTGTSLKNFPTLIRKVPTEIRILPQIDSEPRLPALKPFLRQPA